MLRDGQWAHVRVRAPGDSAGFNKLDATLRASGQIRDGTIGSARALLMRAGDIVQTARVMLKRDPAALLCDDNQCQRCAAARTVLRIPLAP